MYTKWTKVSNKTMTISVLNKSKHVKWIESIYKLMVEYYVQTDIITVQNMIKLSAHTQLSSDEYCSVFQLAWYNGVNSHADIFIMLPSIRLKC